MEVLRGTVERVVFENPESGWCVLKIRVKGRRRLATVVGHSFFPAPGESIEAEGEWESHANFGERFKATRLKMLLPASAGAAEKYLGSGLIAGVGPGLASRLTARFGADVFDIIENAPELMRDVEGIGPARAEAIVAAWREQKAVRALMSFLSAHGLNALMALRILRHLGPDALPIIERNPYRLSSEVEGIGFRSADRIARHLGAKPEAEERLVAALHDRLAHAMARGHCGYPVDLLVNEAAREADVGRAEVAQALGDEIESGRLAEEQIEGRTCVFRYSVVRAEERLAQALLRLARGEAPLVRVRQARSHQQSISATRTEPQRAVALAAPLAQRPLSVEQQVALSKLLGAKIAILTGGPGTGKTTLLRAVHESYRQAGLRVMCCAPTGRAAQRMSEAAGLEARTIHRVLGYDSRLGGFLHRDGVPLNLDYLIVDEASMVGLELMEALVEALPPRAGLLLVGDTEQLPSVQAGRVLESLVESGGFVHAHLSEVFRQAEGRASPIVRAAGEVIHGRLPMAEGGEAMRRLDQTTLRSEDFLFIEAQTPEACLKWVDELVTKRIPALMGDVQVLTPMNLGEVGTRALNTRLQAALNPEAGDRIEHFGRTFSVGDKVIVTENDYEKEVFNGDIGRITQIERDRTSLRVDFGTRRLDFSFSELDRLNLAYAITIHKAQGSEYEAVVIVFGEESAMMLGRNLLYTAITRGRRLVAMVGSRKALARALHADARREKRWSGLALRLAEGLGRSSTPQTSRLPLATRTEQV
jgi:exodeoxyribonuclease V alpha subunit